MYSVHCATYLMKVFSLLSLNGKSDSFHRNEDNDNAHFLYSYVVMHSACLPHTIQVWGLVSFIRFRVLSEPPFR